MILLDTRQRPPVAEANVHAHGIRFESLFPAIAARSRGRGSLAVRLHLAGRGDSMNGIVANANGTVTAPIVDRRISGRNDGKLALNVGKYLRSFLQTNQDIALNCGLATFSFQGHKGNSQVRPLDTAQTRIDGTGTIDLHAQTYELLLTPQRKQPTVFALDRSIRVTGSTRSVEVHLTDRVAVDRKVQVAAGSEVQALVESEATASRSMNGCDTEAYGRSTPTRRGSSDSAMSSGEGPVGPGLRR
jgi:uncharacterized protein involved in outer membrane biogenesis